MPERIAPAATSSTARAARVLDELDRHLAGLDVGRDTNDLLRRVLTVGRRHADISGLAGADLPLLVHSAIAGDERPALPLGAACVAVYLGADLFDDVQDGDIPPEWVGAPRSLLLLAAATTLAAVPQLCIAALDTSADARSRISAEIAATLLAMAAGQHGDLSAAGGSLSEIRAVIERKSGAEFGGFAAAGALLAGADRATVDAYRRFGTALGTAGQIASDLAEVWDPDRCSDLANGTATVAVAHALQHLPGGRKEALQQALTAARDGNDVSADVRGLLWEAGSVAFTALTVQIYCVRARTALDEAGATGPAADELHALVHAAAITSGTDG